jgi:hypothetical protein
MELLSTNVNHSKLRNSSLLVYGTCIGVEAQNIFKKLSKGRIPLKVCLEKEHMDKVGFKLATILTTSKPREITVLTIDGSPHCLQLHFTVEQAKNIANSKVKLTHYVIEHGKLIKISSEAVKMARHLSQIQKLLTHVKHYH